MPVGRLKVHAGLGDQLMTSELDFERDGVWVAIRDPELTRGYDRDLRQAANPIAYYLPESEITDRWVGEASFALLSPARAHNELVATLSDDRQVRIGSRTLSDTDLRAWIKRHLKFNC